MIPSVGLRSAARYAAALLAVCGSMLAPAAGSAAPAPTFGHAIVVQRDGEPALEVDGSPFFFWGGAFFYERIPATQWRNSMLAMRDLGANTLDLYVPWNWHELADGDFDFDGRTDPRRNLREVLRLGAELGFRFIVRPGPVIRNEWRNGGYPAWLLVRPEYDMPLHDVLEGRYPATATLQNAHSDDAAAEWLRNSTHVRYASRWLHRALDEFRPYADRVLAVQLDDDQGAYIDNQTYPAPNFHRYLGWLEAQVREVVGPATPAFINTYQMRVPSSSPVWTMGNWYQSDAYTVAQHDRVELDFSTLLLATNRRGPLAQSEFQAGWLAGAEDPQPRRADPRNTALALDELLALGAKGIIDFPMQDTSAEPGWEAPFSNAAYAWDAALREGTLAQPARSEVSVNPRFWPTYRFGALLTRFAPILLRAHRIAQIGIAYAEPPARGDSRPPEGAGAIVARVRSSISACIERGYTCDLIDLRARTAHVENYAAVVVAPEVATAAPEGVRWLRDRASRSRVRIVDAVPDARGAGTTTLAGPAGRLTFAANWSDAPVTVRFAGAPAVVPPHTAALRIDDVALAAIGAPNDRRRISSNCPIAAEPDAVARTLLVSPDGCTAIVRDGTRTTTFGLAPNESLSLPDLHRTPPRGTDANGPLAFGFGNTEGGDAASGEARVVQSSRDDGGEIVTLRNDRTHITIDARAGARAFTLFTTGADEPPSALARLSVIWRTNVLDATGALRDDLSVPVAASARDYIAKYTHAYPAGTFNRTYTVNVLASGPRAAVRFTYSMPDSDPPGLTFERVVSLAPHSSRIVVDERLVPPGGMPTNQRAVVRSSLPYLSAALSPLTGVAAVALDSFPREKPSEVPQAQTVLAGYRNGIAFAVAWRAGDVERAGWTPYLSTGTLALTLAPGWRRVTYSAVEVGDVARAQAFAEAERAWVAANPATGR
jgi:hypothetical protein